MGPLWNPKVGILGALWGLQGPLTARGCEPRPPRLSLRHPPTVSPTTPNLEGQTKVERSISVIIRVISFSIQNSVWKEKLEIIKRVARFKSLTIIIIDNHPPTVSPTSPGGSDESLVRQNNQKKKWRKTILEINHFQLEAGFGLKKLKWYWNTIVKICFCPVT